MPVARTRSAAKKPQRAVEHAAAPAVVARIDEDPAFVIVRESLKSEELRARLAVPAYEPSEGDRVLVFLDAEEPYVIGVLRARRALSARLADGATVSVEDGAAEIKDERGRLLVRYEGGQARIAAPAGDLVLDAPEGRVVVRGKDIALEAADRLISTAAVIAQSAERVEVHADRLVEKARDVYRDAAELVQTRAGRMRQIVEGAFSLHAKRTQIASEEDTSIDGKRVHLG